ncbi:MAG: methionyl-tRNA formyltransferase, partial [Candidatus Firestonebacteria bacterium]
VLKRLFGSGRHEIEVVTSCDKARGRGMEVKACEVKGLSDFLGLKTYQPEKIKDEGFYKTLKGKGYELGVVVAYGRILSQELIELPLKGTINLHFSLLPKYRGAAPYSWALINGEKVAGVTVMYVKKELDEGDIILQKQIKVESADDAGSLLEKMVIEGGELLVKAVDEIEAGKAKRKEQNKKEATYFGKLPEGIGNIDWEKSAVEIHNLVRGLSPFIGAYSVLNGKLIKILKSEPRVSQEDGAAGEILGVEKGKGLIVKTGKGMLLVKTVKPEGKKEMDFEAYARGNKITSGLRFEREKRK